MTAGARAAGPSPGISCTVVAECDVRPSEDERAVAAALLAILPGSDVRTAGGRARAAASGIGCLSRIAETVRSRSSSAAYLRCLLRNMGRGGAGGGETWLYLNKQAAAAGRIALCAEPDESPLGPVRIALYSPRIDEVVDWLVPGQLNKIQAALEKNFTRPPNTGR